jgi:hypothetical protein
MKTTIATILSAIILSSPLTVMAFTGQQITDNNPAILPGNPFYFIKSWAQDFQNIFISNPVRKVMFSSYVLDQKGAEIAIAMDKEDANISNSTILEYSEKAKNFRAKISELTPEIIEKNLGLVFESSDQLIDYLLERVIVHLKLHLEIFEVNGPSEAVTSLEIALRQNIAKLASLDPTPTLEERILLISKAQDSNFALQFIGQK